MTETKLRSMNSQKKNKVNIQSSWLNKGFIIWLSAEFFFHDAAGSPERARWLHPAHSGSQSQCIISNVTFVITCCFHLGPFKKLKSGQKGGGSLSLEIQAGGGGGSN